MSYPVLPSPVTLTHRGRTYEVRPEHDVTADRDRYSKKWHRSYGPAYDVTARRAALVLVRDDGTSKRLRARDLDSFRGDWSRRALADLLPRAAA